MPSKSIQRWERSHEGSVLDKIRGIFGRKAPLRERIAVCIYRLKIQKAKIAGLYARMEQRDREFFSKCVSAHMAKDLARAVMYADECAEVRKMARIALRCEFTLEQVVLRLETVEEFGDVACLMRPVAVAVRDMRSQVEGIMPRVSFELGLIGEALNGIALEVGDVPVPGYDVSTFGEQAQRILAEASAIADQRMRERFPELPAATIRDRSPEHLMA